MAGRKAGRNVGLTSWVDGMGWRWVGRKVRVMGCLKEMLLDG